jgi:hypothetical protein
MYGTEEAIGSIFRMNTSYRVRVRVMVTSYRVYNGIAGKNSRRMHIGYIFSITMSC